MGLLDWSMTILGYPAHRLSGAAVVGVSHMSTHAALRFAEGIGCYTGWIVADSDQPQLEGLRAGEPTWVALAELFVEGRVANTEGVVSGSLVFASAVPASGPPPEDRSLIAWAEEGGRAWLEVRDNETAYFGGLSDAALEGLLAWFACQRPLDADWRATRFEPSLAEDLRGGLFDHGWTRNGSLVATGRRPQVELWAGVHERSVLEHHEVHRLSAVHRGLRLTLAGDTWRGAEIEGPCPLDDHTGRSVPRLT